MGEVEEAAHPDAENLVCLCYSNSIPESIDDAILVDKAKMGEESKYLQNYLEAAQDGRRIYRKEDGERVEIPKLMIHDRGIYAIIVRNDVLPPALEVFKSYLDNEVFGLQFLDGPDFSRVMKFAKVYNVRTLMTMCTLEEIRRYKSFGDWDEYVKHVEGDTYYTSCHFDKVFTLPPGHESNEK